MQNMDDDKIQSLVQRYLQEYKDGLEKRYLDEPDHFLGAEDFEQYVNDLDSIEHDKIAELGTGDYRWVERVVDGILEKEGVEGVQKGSEDYIKLCRGILRSQIKGIKYEKKFMREELPEEPAPPKETPPVALPPPVPVPEIPSLSLKDLISAFWEESLRSERWSGKTIKEYKNGYKVLTDFLGSETPVRTIGYKELQDYKKLLMKLPSNFSRSKKYPGMTLRDVLESEDIEGSLSVSAINRYLMNAQAVFSYGVRNNHMDINPAEGLQLPKKKRPHEERSPFDGQDLVKIFRSKQYLEDEFVQPFMFWLPILGLYTGCRIEELCQLFCSDVAQFDGIWCLDINDDSEKKLKNRSSRRVVPLHPVLIETLNFTGYAQKQVESGHQRVFHELKKFSHDYSHAAGKWFNERYKARIGLVVKEGEKKSFHSFRHTFDNHLKQKMVPPHVLKEIMGHACRVSPWDDTASPMWQVFCTNRQSRSWTTVSTSAT